MDIHTSIRHLVCYLVGPLQPLVSEETLHVLVQSLEKNLALHYGKSFLHSDDPVCFHVGPHRMPPRPFVAACYAARLRWSTWAATLGGEIQLVVDPWSVNAYWTTPDGDDDSCCVWDASKVVVDRLLLDAEHDAVFVDNAADHNMPFWMAKSIPSIRVHAPAPAPALTIDTNVSPVLTRPSSRESVVSRISLFSEAGSDTTASTVTSPPLSACGRALAEKQGYPFTIPGSSCSPTLVPAADMPVSASARRRRRRGDRQRHRVAVDNTKTDVTDYDHGKTGVLTGGVMLGKRRP